MGMLIYKTALNYLLEKFLLHIFVMALRVLIRPMVKIPPPSNIIELAEMSIYLLS